MTGAGFLSASFFGLPARPFTTARFKGRRGMRGEERRRRHKTQTQTQTHTQRPPLAWGPVAPECCRYELLQYGHEEQKSRGFRDTETHGAPSAMSRAATPRVDEPGRRAGFLATSSRKLLIATKFNAAQQSCGPGQVGGTSPGSPHP